MSAPKKISEPLEFFDVDVWNHDGDVVRRWREITADEVDKIREQYAEEPFLDVVVKECP